MLKTILSAILLFVMDVFVINYYIAIIGSFVLAIICIIWAIKGFRVLLDRKYTAVTKQQLIKTGIYTIMVVSIFIVNGINNRIAESRADILIESCEKYKNKNGEYPRELSDLVPEFIDGIPSVKYSLLNNEFRYYSLRENSHILFYVVVPPFGTRVYNFEHHEWRSLG